MNIHMIPTGELSKGAEYVTRLGQRVRYSGENRYGEWNFRVIGSREELTLAPHYVSRWLRPAMPIRVPE